jgi:hypothetical protein
MVSWSWNGIEKVVMFSSIFIAGWIYFELKTLNTLYDFA